MKEGDRRWTRNDGGGTTDCVAVPATAKQKPLIKMGHRETFFYKYLFVDKFERGIRINRLNETSEKGTS